MSAAEAVNSPGGPARFVVPHHYDMLGTFNTVPVAEFEAEGHTSRGRRPRVLRCGERWEIQR